MAVGKITGQMLGDIYGNLDRDGVDLAFDTDLIYLDVVNRRVGIKTTSPTDDLTVDGTSKTTNLEVATQADIANITISGNTINSNTGTLNLNPLDAVVYQNKLQIDSLQLQGNTISTIDSNADLELRANGTGKINLNSNVLINGDLHATGTITADGNLTLGDNNTDSITFNADIASNIVPDADITYALGTPTQRWNDIWVKNIYASDINAGEIQVDGIDIALRQGNIYYVAANGDDQNTGTHQNDPLSSVGRALDLATSGDTIYIYPGVYQETLPLVVPAGVTVKGAGLRSVIIEPDSDVTVDMFLLNGETTVEDITIRGFEYDVGTNTGYAFRFAPGFKVTTRSPYIRNVTVLTFGSTVRLMTNPADDPRGFLAGDAGKGAYIDGSIADPTSREASMLFHSVTFICPGVDAITMTNGVRVEWLNCFTYFANRGLYALSGSSGFASDGKTRIKISNKTGTFAVGNTLSYYDTDGVTVLASGTIESVDGNFYVIDGKALGFETITDRDPKTVYANGNAKLSTAQKKFGSSSLVLDGVGDYINIDPQPDFNFGTGDFTIEAWVRPTTSGTYRTLFDFRTTSPGDGNGIIIGIDNLDQLYFYYNFGFRIGAAGSIPVNTWTHIAFSRSSGNTKLWINGSQVGSTYVDANNYPERGIRVGADPNGAYEFSGYIDDIRICKGTAKYTTTFSVPTAALTGDTSTVLLLHLDGANNSTTIIDDGVTLQDVRTSAGGTASVIDFADYSDFGAEIRSIASASVYGNYGAYGDGDGVIGYLISTNFAYIGSGQFSNNDPTNTIQANEVVELNRAQLYYTTVDNKGDFRVGDYFFVDQKNGNVTFSASTIEILSPTGVTFTDGVNTTIVNPTKVETGNIRISGNTIESTTGGITLTAANNTISVTSNVDIAGTLDVTNNFTVNGNTTIGNTSADTITVNSQINTTLIPDLNTTYNIGSSTNQWKNVYLAEAQIDDISIAGNLIQTTVSNSNLELRANGTGSIRIDQFDISNNLITANTGNTDINLTPTGTGRVKLNSSTDVTGNLSITGNIVLGGNIQIGDAASDTINLVGVITNNLIPQSSGTYNIGSNVARWRNIYASGMQIDDIEINDNYIRTTASNANLELRYSGTGAIRIDQLDFKNNLIAANTTNASVQVQANGTGTIQLLSNTNVTGDLSTTGNLVVNGNTVIGNSNSDSVNFVSKVSSNIVPQTNSTYNLGSALLRWNNLYSTYALIDDVEINDNYIKATASNSNLELRYSGTGSVRIDQLDFKNNTITANTLNTDINLNPTGTGQVKLNSSTDVTGNFTVSGTSNLNGNTIVGNASTDTATFNSRISSDFVPETTSVYNLGLSNYRWNTLYVSQAIIDDITIDTNVIQSTLSNQNLELRANGTGSIQIDQLNFKNNLISSNTIDTDIQINPNGTGKIQLLKNTNITGNLDVTGNIALGGNITIGDQSGDTINLVGSISNNIVPSANSVYNIGASNYRWANLYASRVLVDDIVIDTNVIQSTLSNQNLELRANGTGSIRIDVLDFKNNTISSNSTNADIGISPNGTGKIQLLKDTIVTGNLGVTGNILLGGNITIGDQSSDTINLVGVITNNLIPQSSGTYNIGSNLLRWKNSYFSNLVVDDIEINDNYIRTTASNANLELRANGTGSIRIDSLDIKSNIISANTLNTDINITPTGTGRVKLNANTDVTGNLSVTGNITLGGNIQIGDQSSDTINLVGVITNNLIPQSSGTYNIGSPTASWKGLYASSLIVDDIEINDNYIRAIASNADLELRASGTGSVVIDQISFKGNTVSSNVPNGDIIFIPSGSGVSRFLSNAVADNNLSVNGTVQTNGNTTFGNSTSDTVNFIGRISSNFIPNTSTGYALGSSSNRWKNIYSDNLSVDNITVNDNYITTISSNADLELRANGSGVVRIPTNNLVVDQNFTVSSGTTNLKNTNINGVLTVASLTLNNQVLANSFTTGDIEIQGNVIRTTVSNSDLELRANGSGAVQIENISVNGSSITGTVSGQDIELTPSGTGIVKINSNQSLAIPVGTTGQRPLVPTTGMMRFNTSLNRYEGYNGANWIPLGGISDVDGNTYITAELTPGANDNTLRFYSNGTIAATLNSTEFTANKVVVDDIEIDGNVIRTTASNADLELNANGTGGVVFENIKFTQSTITNTTNNAITEFRSTGTGYYSIVGANAFVIPSGGNSNRPGVPVTGMMRFNIDQQLVEIYDGVTWTSVAGATSGISAATAQEIAITTALIFG